MTAMRRLGPGSSIVVERETLGLGRTVRWLDRAGHTVRTVDGSASCLDALAKGEPDLLIVGLEPRDLTNTHWLSEVRGQYGRVAVLVVTESGAAARVAVALPALGANDYLIAPLEDVSFIAAAQHVLEVQRLNHQVASLQREVRGQGFSGIVGQSTVMKRLFREIERVAPSDITVLVHGESGSGKELIARAIHERSPRHRRALVAVNCAAIPDTLQESELFGHETGAFTGATERRTGRFEQADGGTLFFDEVAELSAAAQAKLLRVLQEQCFTRVGGAGEISVDVRVVAATHRRLADEVAAGRFREDLYYRLAVMELEVPPLRAREGDIALLAHMFLEEFDAALGKVDERAFDMEALRALDRYAWPGNVRELRNAIHRASVLAAGDLVQLTDLPPALRRDASSEPDRPSVHEPPPAPVDEPAASDPRPLTIPGGMTLEDLERLAVVQALHRNRDNISATARELGIGRSALYRKMDAYGLR
jgi:DNA-binding NtrC family response regulator